MRYIPGGEVHIPIRPAPVTQLERRWAKVPVLGRRTARSIEQRERTFAWINTLSDQDQERVGNVVGFISGIDFSGGLGRTKLSVVAVPSQNPTDPIDIRVFNSAPANSEDRERAIATVEGGLRLKFRRDKTKHQEFIGDHPYFFLAGIPDQQLSPTKVTVARELSVDQIQSSQPPVVFF